MNKIEIHPVNLKYRDAVIKLLRSERLPVEDLPATLPNFFVAVDNGVVVGAIGLETYERYGLLRSLVVTPEHRKMKIAAALVNEVETVARNLGLYVIYLLTETAQEYFLKGGYVIIDRNDTPGSLLQSSEFSHVCPASAITMKKALEHFETAAKK